VLGARAPAHTVSSGLMLLALLSAPEFDAWLKRTPLAAFTNFTITEPKRLRATVAEVCARGYAVSSQAMSLHERGVAVALRNRFGVALGAINVTMPLLIDGKLESAEHAVARVLPVLQETAQVLRELI
jgi:IclR family transcriptional regulator, pca regulon regulatory protein